MSNYNTQLQSNNTDLQAVLQTLQTKATNANAVLYTEQTLTEEQQAQARNNIGAASTNEMMELIYPVGSIYISVNETNPGTLFGGTWERLKDRFLLGSGGAFANGATGGETSHTLTIDEIPSHTHDGHSQTIPQGDGSNKSALCRTIYGDIAAEPITLSTGGGQAHNNMPPYLAVSIWKRTA